MRTSSRQDGRKYRQRSKRPLLGRLGSVAFLIVLLSVVSVAVWGSVHRSAQRDKAGRALLWAVYERDTPALIAALQAGADPNVRSDASEYGTVRRTGLWDYLGDWLRGLRGEPPQATGTPTALMWAVRCVDGAPDASAVRVLIEAGANVNLRDSRGCTALDYAYENGYPPNGPVPQLLIQAGGKANMQWW